MTFVQASNTQAENALQKAQDELAHLFESIAEFWGFTRTQGRIFGLLYLSPMPLDHRTIRERLGISAGSTSMTLATLQDWGVVQRQERHYRAETDLWKLITNVIRRREQEKITDALVRLRRAMDCFQNLDAKEPYVKFAFERLRYLHDFFQLGHALLNALIRQSPVHFILQNLAHRASRRWAPFSSVSHADFHT